MLARTLARGITHLLPVLILAACSSPRFAIEYDYDSEADFDGLATWSWLAAGKSGAGSEEVDGMIRDALVKLLERSGYRHVDSGGDFRVGFLVETRRRIKTRTVDIHYEYDWHYDFNGVGGPEVDVVDYREGTLILDVARADGKKPIWRGWASGTIREGATSDQVRADVFEACRRVLEKFPPPATRKKRG